MKNRKVILSILFIVLTLAGLGIGLTQSKEQDVRKIVWNRLSNEQRKEIIGTWSDATLEKVNNGTYHVVFHTTRDGLLGPIGVYIDPETKEIVGKDGRM